MTILTALMRGRLLAGRYHVTAMLGHGAMGAVFEAMDRDLERTVAIKIIGIINLQDPEAEAHLRERFYREARLAAGLRHPHLVTVHDLRVDDETGIDFIVMERLEGEDLQKRMDRGTGSDVDWVLEVLLQAADALGAAHAAGLVHRDVKPANLFLEAGIAPRVRLMDFGIALVQATLQDSSPRLSRYGAPMTPAYAAPELLQDTLDVGPQCDVFSLAATGYELLTGERPFSDEEREMMADGWAGRAASLAHADNVPPELARVLEKALSHDPAARHSDANELADALREIKEARQKAVTPVQPPPGLDPEQLRFHLAAVEMVSRTFAVVRGSDETERLVLDAIGEVFFAWWAALYHIEGEQYTCRAVRSLRGESVAYAIPARVVRDLAARNPTIPPDDAEIRDHVPAEVAVVAPLDFGEGNAGLLILGRRMTDAPYTDPDLALLRSLAEAGTIALRNAELLDRLRAQASIDPLTGCFNRRGCDELLQTGVTRANRYGRPLSLALIEVDHFQRFRDDFGDEAADHALQRIGRALRHTFSERDHACRYDGPEFALVMEETEKDLAMRLAERLRVLIESLPPNAEVPRALTVSIGVASFPMDGDTPGDVWRAARKAQYLARTNGRNRVE